MSLVHEYFRIAQFSFALIVVSLGLAARESGFAQRPDSETDSARPGQLESEEETESVRPGINDSFLDPNMSVEDFLARFEVESREVFLHRKKLVSLLEIQKGQSVADVGAGTGAFMQEFSASVGADGTVLAVDISPRMVEYLEQRAEVKGLRNVEVRQCDERNTLLEPDSVNLVFTCDTYHHFEFPFDTLASIFRGLKPGGRFVIIDFEKIEGVSREWTMSHVRAGKSQVIDEVQSAGFGLLEEIDVEELEENYFLVFQRPQS